MLDIYWSIEYHEYHVIVYSFWGKSRFLLCTLVLAYPYGRYYVLPFMSRNHIEYIIPNDQLLFFDHSFFHSIHFFILSYLSYPWWYSSFEVDLPLSEALSSVMVSLTLGASDSYSLEWILNCHHLFFRTSLILLVGGCTGTFLQFKCTSYMVRTIS